MSPHPCKLVISFKKVLHRKCNLIQASRAEDLERVAKVEVVDLNPVRKEERVKARAEEKRVRVALPAKAERSQAVVLLAKAERSQAAALPARAEKREAQARVALPKEAHSILKNIILMKTMDQTVY